DEGRSYRQAAVAAPDEKAFRFEAPHDGTYYFVMQTVTADRSEPAVVTDAKPMLRVRVDTSSVPSFSIKAEWRGGGDAEAAWEVAADKLDLTTLQLDYQVPGDQEWSPLPVPKTATGKVTWRAPVGETVFVRLRVGYKAGNG